MLEKILKAFPDTPFITIDGFDNAVIGVRFIEDGSHLEYDFEGIISELLKRDGMTRDEAVDYFYFNIESLAGMTNGPLFIFDEDLD